MDNGDFKPLSYLYRVKKKSLTLLRFREIKQNLPGQIRELIDLYRQEGNSAKVSEWTYKLDAIESVLQIRM